MTSRAQPPAVGGGASEDGDDPVLRALADLVDAAAEVERAVQMLRARADGMHTARRAGATWRDVIDGEERPLIAEMLTTTIQQFERTGTRFRQAKARALHDEGMTMDKIAELFGISRQRVSVLLQGSAARRG